MKFVNRCVVTLKPREGFKSWVTSLNGELPEDWSFEGGSYLLNEHDSEDELLAAIKAGACDIVENECVAWSEDESKWPEVRNFDLLADWFDLHIAIAAFDLGKQPLLRVDMTDVSFI